MSSGWHNEPRRHALAAKGIKTAQNPLQKLQSYDYDILPSGARTVTWSGMEKRKQNLYTLQERYRPLLLKELKRQGYKVEKTERVSDGWGDGFIIDKITTTDNRTGEKKVFYGTDDNSGIMEEFPSGGRGAFADVPGAKPWYKVEKELK